MPRPQVAALRFWGAPRRGVCVRADASALIPTGGYSADHPVIRVFWRVVEGFTDEEKRKLLKFVTSCSRPPLLGFKVRGPAVCGVWPRACSPGRPGLSVPGGSKCQPDPDVRVTTRIPGAGPGLAEGSCGRDSLGLGWGPRAELAGRKGPSPRCCSSLRRAQAKTGSYRVFGERRGERKSWGPLHPTARRRPPGNS